MARGDIVTIEQEIRIFEVALKLLEEGKSIDEVRDQAAQKLGRSLSVSKVEKLVRRWVKDGKLPTREEIRKRLRAPKAKTSDTATQEDAWSLGVLSTFYTLFPPSAVKHVVALWRYCAAAGKVLTVREAKWAGRIALYTWGEDLDDRLSEVALYLWCQQYARRERASRALGKPCDTADLDASLFMADWEYHTAIAVGSLHPAATREETAIVGTPAEHVEVECLSRINAEGLIEPLLPEVEQDFFSPTENYVYAYWLRYLTKGPRWPLLSDKQKIKAVELLRRWVKELPRVSPDYPLVQTPVPVELLSKVGLLPPTPTATPNNEKEGAP